LKHNNIYSVSYPKLTIFFAANINSSASLGYYIKSPTAMKLVKKITLWFFTGILVIVLLVIIFRNEIVIKIMNMEKSAQMKKPISMLELPTLDDSTYNALAKDFNKYACDPFEYIVTEFNDHDIIFLGENHRIKHDLLFMCELIPVLYENGIRNMGFEFALEKDSSLIKEVINNKAFFNQEKANQILFNLIPYWGYKEYVDIFRSAWELNKNLPDTAEKFMIYGIMHDYDFSQMKTRSDEYNEEVMLKVRKGVADPEGFMANSIINTFVESNRKALIYCGIHHAFTGYKGHGNRVGVIVKDKIGDKTMTIALHYPWPGKKGFTDRSVYPVNGYIDAFIRNFKSKEYAFGINVNLTSFGNLVDTTSYYNTDDYMKLSSFCDGYIYLNAFSTAKGVTVQKNFINRKNYKYAKSQLPNPELREGIFRFVGPRALNEIAGMDADMEYRFRHLY